MRTLKTNLTQSRKDAKNHANNTVIEHEDAGQTRLRTQPFGTIRWPQLAIRASSYLRLCGLA